jgi:cell wall-associated NlpC family hydrolase
MTGVLLSAVLLAGCASDPIGDLSSEAPVLTSKDKQLHSSVMSSYDSWKGTPYRLGGNGRNGIDCSAFVQQVYQEFNQRYPNSLYSSPLPRTTSHQWAASSSVSNQNAKVGDLVFFKTGIKQRHVGVYLGNYDFVHASTSRGVIISSLTTPYWRTHFEGFRRP